jgi:pantoate--beta-alanine ligase
MVVPLVVREILALRTLLETRRASGGRVGLVPTMGALHDGHASLIERAVDDGNDEVVLTIFVNPLQFAPHEDLDAYPRTWESDLSIAKRCGATVVFAPAVEEMYPGGREAVRTTVHVTGITERLEGASRPAFFDGVATVVAKLFAIAGPCRAYFGEKDFQQLAVVRRMALDLSLPVEVVGCPTVREPHGLARSSRNVYLSDEQRENAGVLHRALLAGAEAVSSGERNADVVRAVMAAIVATESSVTLDYAEVLDAASFDVPEPLHGALRLLVAARVGPARLIDNLGVIAS